MLSEFQLNKDSLKINKLYSLLNYKLKDKIFTFRFPIK